MNSRGRFPTTRRVTAGSPMRSAGDGGILPARRSTRLARPEDGTIASVRVRDAVASDHAAVLALNNAATPHVNELSTHEFSWIVSHADYFRVAEDDAGLAAFVIALGAGVAYWSLNYRWFMERGDDFLYLDRIVVAQSAGPHRVGAAP